MVRQSNLVLISTLAAVGPAGVEVVTFSAVYLCVR